MNGGIRVNRARVLLVILHAPLDRVGLAADFTAQMRVTNALSCIAGTTPGSRRERLQ